MPDQHGRDILAIDQATVSGFAHSRGHIGAWTLRGRSREEKFSMLRTLLMKAHQDWPYEAIVYEDVNVGFRGKAAVEFQVGLVTTIRQAANDTGVEILPPYAPSTIKKWLTGHGDALKSDMVRCVKLHWGIELLPEQHDIADAVALLKAAEGGFIPPAVTNKAARKREKKQRKTDPRLFV